MKATSARVLVMTVSAMVAGTTAIRPYNVPTIRHLRTRDKSRKRSVRIVTNIRSLLTRNAQPHADWSLRNDQSFYKEFVRATTGAAQEELLRATYFFPRIARAAAESFIGSLMRRMPSNLKSAPATAGAVGTRPISPTP